MFIVLATLLLTREIAQTDEMLATVNARSQFTSGRRRRCAGGRVDDGSGATRVHDDVTAKKTTTFNRSSVHS